VETLKENVVDVERVNIELYK